MCFFRYLVDKLSNSKITINSGIFTFSKMDNGQISSIKEYYKTNQNSDNVMINEFFHFEKISNIWDRRSNLNGISLKAITE